MNDSRIVDLFWQRSELAISETAAVYGSYLYQIAYRILQNPEDAEESINDTYHDAWNSMPPHRPAVLKTFLGKITRRVALDKYRKRMALKRGGGEVQLALEELSDCASGEEDPADSLIRQEMAASIRSFVAALPESEQRIFICRYWYLDSVKSISEQFGFTESKVTAMLRRSRVKLRKHLEKEGY